MVKVRDSQPKEADTMETAKVDIRKLQLLNDRINQCIDGCTGRDRRGPEPRLRIRTRTHAQWVRAEPVRAARNRPEPGRPVRVSECLRPGAVHAGILPRVRGIPAADRGFRNRDESADGGLDPYEPGCARRIPAPRVGRPSSDGEDRANVPLRAVAGPAHRDDLLK